MTTLSLLLYLVIPVVTGAQPQTSTSVPPVTRATGAFFALSVPDLNASARWYSEKLGLQIVMQSPKTDKAAAIVLEGGGLIVELIQHDDAVPLSGLAKGLTNHILVHGIVKAGVIVDDFDKLLATLTARDVRIAFGPYPARADGRANVIIEDNAGNLIQLFGNRMQTQ